MTHRLITASGILCSFSFLLISLPVLGELIATVSPVFTNQDEISVSRLGIPYEQVSFPTADGLTLRGWFFPNKDLHAPAILYAPGTANDQRQGLSLVAPLHQAGFQVLLFSYRGHGNSQGDRFGFSYGARESQDIDAAVHYLSETRQIQRIGVIGHSAGAVSAILSASRNPRIDALVAASPYATLEEIWEENRPAFFPKPIYQFFTRLFEMRKNFSRRQVRPLDVIEQIAPRPVMLVHGLNDQRVSVEQAQSLFAAARQPKEIIWISGASHAQVRSPGLDNLIKQIVQFFDASFNSTAALGLRP